MPYSQNPSNITDTHITGNVPPVYPDIGLNANATNSPGITVIGWNVVIIEGRAVPAVVYDDVDVADMIPKGNLRYAFVGDAEFVKSAVANEIAELPYAKCQKIIGADAVPPDATVPTDKSIRHPVIINFLDVVDVVGRGT